MKLIMIVCLGLIKLIDRYYEQTVSKALVFYVLRRHYSIGVA